MESPQPKNNIHKFTGGEDMGVVTNDIGDRWSDYVSGRVQIQLATINYLLKLWLSNVSLTPPSLSDYKKNKNKIKFPFQTS